MKKTERDADYANDQSLFNERALHNERDHLSHSTIKDGHPTIMSA